MFFPYFYEYRMDQHLHRILYHAFTWLLEWKKFLVAFYAVGQQV